jgi:uncharacterized membrane protein (DUF106 family)
MVLDSIFNAAFGWAIEMSPLFGIIVISFTLTLFVTIVYKLTTDQETLRNIKQEMKNIRKEIKEVANDPTKIEELRKKSMEKSMIQMRHTMKPLLITTVPLLLAIKWLISTYQDKPLNFFGIHSGLWAYIVLSLIFNIIMRKILKVH